MADRKYRILMTVAITLTLAWVGWSIWDGYLKRGGQPGDMAYHAGNTAFDDGNYDRAVRLYREALDTAPDHVHAWRHLGNALNMLERFEDAEQAYNRAIELTPEFAGTYANRGILRDRMGRHRDALTDYEYALYLDQSVNEGPGWLTRFFRLQVDPPPTVADRAAYLRYQFTLPEEERQLRAPEADSEARPYKL
ncbi:MAG: tetratricopeptide repeat protein [Aquisalimonadaceae bacterium]